MRKFRGSALVDYAIPTLIVGVAAGVGFTYMLSNGLLTNFVAASSNMKVESGKGYVGNNPLTTTTTTTTTTTPASTFTSVATPDNPIINCLAGKCSINFGDFVLNNVEEDMAAYIASNGSSKGTDQLMALLEQMADQLGADETIGDDEVATLKDMANLGHFIARYEQGLEDYAGSSGAINKELIAAVDLPTNLDTVLTDFDFTCGTLMAPAACTMDDKYNSVLGSTFADILSMKTAMPGVYADSVKDSPMYAFYDKYFEVMNSSTYPDSAKKVVQEVLLSLDDIIVNFQNQATNIEYPGVTTFNHKDPLTGDVIESNISYTTDVADLTNPQASFYTDLDSAIICTAGKDVDSSKACHN